MKKLRVIIKITNYIQNLHYFCTRWELLMKYMLRENKIEELDLSTRVINALHGAGIKLIGDLLACSEADLLELKNLGKKSLTEIEDIIKSLKNDDEFLYLPSKHLDISTVNTFMWTDGKEYHDINTADMHLSVRAYNSLTKSNLHFFSQVYKLSESDLTAIPCIGSGSVSEILEAINSIKLVAISPKEKTEVDLLYDTLIANLKSKVEFNVSQSYATILKVCKQFYESPSYKSYCNGDKNIFSEFLVANSHIRSILKKHILKLLDDDLYGLKFGDINKNMPNFFTKKALTLQIIDELLNENKINLFNDEFYIVNHPPFARTSKIYLKEKEWSVINERILGKTLSEIGRNLNITRERIRQIEVKGLNKIKTSGLKFKEDIYSEIFKNYDFSKENFLLAFDGDVSTYNYLYLFYEKKNKQSLDDILYDEAVPMCFKKKIEKAVYKNYVLIDGQYIKLSKEALSIYILRNFAPKGITFQEFVDLYAELLEQIGMSHKSSLALMDRGYENKLAASEMVLWKYGKQFRYYNMKVYNFKYLLESLSLNQYQNVEYSSLKFFRAYPELMEEYDIHDEYELHNLLKKICNKKDYPNIDFKRMPNIEFGVAKRESQILSLLSALSPISNNEFAQEYENVYGVRASTVLANYMKNFDEYFYDGVYQIDFPSLSQGKQDKLKSYLTKDFYLFTDILSIYKKIFPNEDESLVNPYSLKALGFKTYSNYAINSKFHSAVEFFNYILTKDDSCDVSTFPKGVKNTIAYTAELYRLKASYDIIELKAGTFISIRKLNSLGISKENLEEYCKDVLSLVKNNEYFTIHSLKESGFNHKLHELNFDNWFYTSVIIQNKNSLSYKRIHGNKLLYKGKQTLTLSKFIEFFVDKSKKPFYSLSELSAKINDKYAIKVDIYQISEIAKSSSLYFDPISKNVYKNYKTYLSKNS